MLDKTYITAGNATLTVENPHGEYYTYKVRTPKDKPEPFFVSLLTGPDNNHSYTYLGLLNADDGSVRLTKASKFNDETKPVKVIRWAMRKLWNGEELPLGYKVRHNGHCGRCGRTLTTPESLDCGIGPECRKHL